MFPAGFIDYGEHPEETLIHEVKEETGLTVKNFKLIKVDQSLDDPRQPGHFLFLYLTKINPNRLKTDQDENSDIHWFNLHQLPPKIGWKNHRQMLKWLQDKHRD